MNNIDKRKIYTYLILAALLISAITIFLPFVNVTLLGGASLFDVGNALGEEAKWYKTSFFGNRPSDEALATSRTYSACSIVIYVLCIAYIGLLVISMIKAIKALLNGNKKKLSLGAGPIYAISLYAVVLALYAFYLSYIDAQLSYFSSSAFYSLAGLGSANNFSNYIQLTAWPFVGIVLSIAAIVLCKLRNAEPVVSAAPSPEPSVETPIIERAPAAPAAPVSTKAPATPAAPVSRSTPKAAPASDGARCPSCGKALRTGTAFCIYCGTPLAPAPSKPVEEKPELVPPAAETGSKLRINMRVDKTSSGGDAKPSASGFKPAGNSDLD